MDKTRTAGLPRSAGLSLSLVLAVLVIDYADQSLLPPLVNTLLLDFFGDASHVVPLGWVSFIFTVLSALSMIAAGYFSDRFSRIKICRLGCLIAGLFSLLTLLVPEGGSGYPLYFITRALNGIGIGMILPSLYSLVSDTVPTRFRTSAFGGLSAAMLTGRMTGFILAGALIAAWRYAYVLLGALSLFLAFALSRAREPQRGEQDQELQSALSSGAVYRFRVNRKDLIHLSSNRSNVWLILNFIDAIPGSMIIFLIFKYMQDKHGMSFGAINSTVGLTILFGAFGALIFGRLGDWGFQKNQRAKAWIALACNGLPMICLLVFLRADFLLPPGASFSEVLAVPGAPVLIGSILLAMFINQGVNPNWFGILTDINLPEHRAAVVSLATVMDMAGFALGPLIASYVTTYWGLQTAMSSVLLFWGLNIFLWIPVLIQVRSDLDRKREILLKRAVLLKQDLH